MLRGFTLLTGQNNWTDITSRAREALRESGIQDGGCIMAKPFYRYRENRE